MTSPKNPISLWKGLRALFDRECPGPARLAAAAGLLYAVFPFDLAPDAVPVLGWIDDVAVVSVLLALASRIWSSKSASAVARAVARPPLRRTGR
ncbi:MAG: DUF1232 domain-containing protein [Fimbriimonadaceae bacterium]